jgi:hypothetical protein
LSFLLPISQVSQYLREGLKRGQDTLGEAGAERYILVTSFLFLIPKSEFPPPLFQVSQYLREGLERGQATLAEAAAKRERYMIGTSVSRRVAAAAASAAEAAANAGESSVRAFMLAVQRATTGVAMLQQHFVTSIARLVMPGEGYTVACSQVRSLPSFHFASVLSNSSNGILLGGNAETTPARR